MVGCTGSKNSHRWLRIEAKNPCLVNLSPLAGQTVQLILVVRDQGTPEGDWVLWIYPYVACAAP